MADMYHRPPQPSKEERTSWVDRYRASSLGLRQFAQENALSIHSLRYWVYGQGHRKSHKLDPNAPPVFQEIQLTGGLALESWAVEVSLPSGLAVRFQAAANPAWIGSVVQALQSPC